MCLDPHCESQKDRAIGCFIGLAVGDALGAPLEFGPRRKDEDHREMIAGGPFNLPAGCFTDDTSMALALAASTVKHLGFHDTSAIGNFIAWFRQGRYSPMGRCFDIGNQTRFALEFHEDNVSDRAPVQPDAKGNGAIMRLAPIPIFYRGRPDYAARYGAEQAALTHCNDLQASANAWLSFSLAKQITGHPSFDTLKQIADRADGDTYLTDQDVRLAVSKDWRSVSRDQISSSGHVIDTLEAALWSVATTDTFEAAVVRAVNLGNDSDTVGAVTGQIAGAIYGLSNIPERWLDALAWKDELLAMARSLLRDD